MENLSVSPRPPYRIFDKPPYMTSHLYKVARISHPNISTASDDINVFGINRIKPKTFICVMRDEGCARAWFQTVGRFHFWNCSRIMEKKSQTTLWSCVTKSQFINCYCKFAHVYNF